MNWLGSMKLRERALTTRPYDAVVQWSEQRPLQVCVVGSNPTSVANKGLI